MSQSSTISVMGDDTSAGLGPEASTSLLERAPQPVGPLAYSDALELDTDLPGRSWGDAWRRATSWAVAGALIAVAVFIVAADDRNPDAGLSTAPVSTAPTAAIQPVALPPPIINPKIPDIATEQPPPPPATPPPSPPDAPSPPTANPTPAPTPSDPLADRQYLAQLAAGGITITDTQAAIESGRATCAYLTTGHTLYDAVRLMVHNNPALPPGAAQTAVVVSVQVYCPQYGS